MRVESINWSRKPSIEFLFTYRDTDGRLLSREEKGSAKIGGRLSICQVRTTSLTFCSTLGSGAAFSISILTFDDLGVIRTRRVRTTGISIEPNSNREAARGRCFQSG